MCSNPSLLFICTFSRARDLKLSVRMNLPLFFHFNTKWKEREKAGEKERQRGGSRVTEIEGQSISIHKWG